LNQKAKKENTLNEQSLKSKIEDLEVENKHLCGEYNVKIQEFINFKYCKNEINETLCKSIKEIKSEYENLIKEAKLVVEESEREYSNLVKNIEVERLAKVSNKESSNIGVTNTYN
jgi:hypothetical protein